MTVQDVPCPHDIAAIDDALYFIVTPGLGSATELWTARSDGHGVQVLAAGLRWAHSVRADVDHVYWLDDAGLSRIPREGGGPSELLVAASRSSGSMVSLVLDDRNAYWLDSSERALLRVPKSGGSPQTIAEVAQPLELALSSAGLFWLAKPGFPDAELVALPWDADAPIALASVASDAHSLVAFDDTVYWLEGDALAGSVLGARLGNGEPFSVAGYEAGPAALAVDEQYLFWTNDNYPEVVGNMGEVVRMCR